MHKDRYQNIYYDTIVENHREQPAFVQSGKFVERFVYDSTGSILYSTYGKQNAKNNKWQYKHAYDYYPQRWDTVSADALLCKCNIFAGKNLLKRYVMSSYKGDTITHFIYKYKMDAEGKV